MKYIIMFLLLVSTLNCLSQDLKKTNNHNSIFILFDKNTDEHQKKQCDRDNNEKTMLRCRYKFTFIDKNKYTYRDTIISFSYREYADFDEMARNNPVPVFKVDKRFIKDNKDVIITLDIMQKLGYDKSIELFRNTKHIFLIDTSEMENNQVTIKEVYLVFNVE